MIFEDCQRIGSLCLGSLDDYNSILSMPYSISTGALKSPDLYLSYSIIKIPLYNYHHTNNNHTPNLSSTKPAVMEGLEDISPAYVLKTLSRLQQQCGVLVKDRGERDRKISDLTRAQEALRRERTEKDSQMGTCVLTRGHASQMYELLLSCSKNPKRDVIFLIITNTVCCMTNSSSSIL